MLNTEIVGKGENRLKETDLTRTRNICLKQNIRKYLYPCKFQFHYIYHKSGMEGGLHYTNIMLHGK